MRQRGRCGSPLFRMLSVLVMTASALVGLSPTVLAERSDLRIVTVSTRPDTVSGGDVLVRIEVPREVSFNAVTVLLNGQDVTSAFQPDPSGNGLLGLVEGLRLGDNTLVAEVTRRGKGRHHRAELTLTNYPITGPVFSGPHEEPFYCQTHQFRVYPGGPFLTAAPITDPCSVPTRVDYVYRSTGGSFKALPAGPPPTDLARTTTSQGKSVPYMVRIETGTINRAIYQTALLHNPAAEPPPTPFAPPAAWNHRLVYTLGGGCVGGWYIQGASLGNGGILEDLMLRQGYAVASSSLNVFGNNCQEVLAAESLMMVKERFIENVGAPLFTIGYGCSGGSEQAHPISDDYPGLMDGIIVGCSFPEVTAAMVLNITDADLFLHYLQHGTALAWTDAQIIAATGYPTVTTLATIGPGNAVRTKAQGGTCNALIPAATRYDALTNPTGCAATSTITWSISSGGTRRPDSRGGRSTISVCSTGSAPSTPAPSASSSSSI